MHVFESVNTHRYAKCIEVSKRIRWDIERDVIRGRDFDTDHKFLPDGLSFADRIDSLSAGERRLLSQIQGRTYANMFGLVERFIGAKMLDITRDHALGDQTAFEALIRFTDEELKHQRLFRRIELLAAEQCLTATGSYLNPMTSPTCTGQVDLASGLDVSHRILRKCITGKASNPTSSCRPLQGRVLLPLEEESSTRSSMSSNGRVR